MLAVTILGNNSALPAFDRHPTAQVITMDDRLFLVDCGEGTQSQMAKYKIRRSKISHIFISHLHGDHYFGLIGLLTSMGLLGRTQEIHLYAPAALKSIIDLQLQVADTQLPFALHFHPLVQQGVLVKENTFEVSCFQVQHRVECWGFHFREIKPIRKINPEKALAYQVPASFFEQLKWGADYLSKTNELVKNEWVTDSGSPAKSYAYSADTVYDERIIESVKSCSLLYHEATYLKDMEDRATKRFHCTTAQAATIAKKAQVGKLLIGHFSSKYERLEDFEKEAREIFANTELAIEGVTYKV
ncbi:MAG: ribonuclease Z [Bacteroidetes bacterium]|nr:ribonuclease Z [Bacteroidota bacterium]